MRSRTPRRIQGYVADLVRIIGPPPIRKGFVHKLGLTSTRLITTKYCDLSPSKRMDSTLIRVMWCSENAGHQVGYYLPDNMRQKQAKLAYHLKLFEKQLTSTPFGE